MSQRAKTKREMSAETLARLAKEGVERRSPMSQIELRAEETKRSVGQAEVDKELAALPPENDRAKGCPRCGRQARIRARAMPRTFQSLSGTHTIRRNYHFCEQCKEGFFPRDEFLGLPREGELSEELEARAADFAVNDVYALAERRWNFHYAHQVSANQFRQVAKRLGKKLEEANPVVVHGGLLPPELTSSSTLYVMNDGGMVPMREGKWNEVKVGVMFRDEDHLSHREAKRGALTRARYVAILGEQEEFKNEMRAAFAVENGVAAKRLAWLGDGALGNWNLASFIAPGAIQILDWNHAVENGMKCAKALLGEGDVALPQWQQRLQMLLWPGDVKAITQELEECRALTDAAGNAAIDDLLRYYKTNEHRMRYAQFQAEGLLIGSGIVESAHRHVIQTRMKRAGQHWGCQGGSRMARLRAAYRTAGPETFYRAVHWAHRQSDRAQLPAKPIKRRASNR